LSYYEVVLEHLTKDTMDGNIVKIEQIFFMHRSLCIASLIVSIFITNTKGTYEPFCKLLGATLLYALICK